MPTTERMTMTATKRLMKVTFFFPDYQTTYRGG
jgi:hypothetical protein